MQQILLEAPVATLVFIFTIATSIYAFYNPGLYGNLMLHPYSVYRRKNVHQLITSGFIHKDWPHLIFNMLSYYFFAFNLERIVGHWQFGAIYFLSLILCDIPSIQRHKNHFWYNSLGASGAVCAVVFSYILFFPLTTLIIFPIPFPVYAVLYGVLFLAYTTYAGRKANDGINHDAHFFGAFAGVVLTIILYPRVIDHFFATIQQGFF